VNKILNEKQTEEMMNVLREKFGKIAPHAAEAINMHQPFNVNPKVGIVATVAGMVVGNAAAKTVENAIKTKKTVSFFSKSIVKGVIDSYKAARKEYTDMELAYETMVRNLKTEVTKPAPAVNVEEDK
jgi:hypothetical protein